MGKFHTLKDKVGKYVYFSFTNYGKKENHPLEQFSNRVVKIDEVNPTGTILKLKLFLEEKK